MIGSWSDSHATTVYVNDLASNGSGQSFQRTVNLVMGSNTISVRAVDAAFNSEGLTRTVIRKPVGVPESNDPVVTITSPYAGQFFGQGATIPVSGTVTDESGISSLTVTSSRNPQSSIPLNLSSGGSYSGVISLSDGSQTLTVKARDVWNNEGTASVDITVDSTPPVIRFWDPQPGQTVNTTPYPVTGTVVEEYLSSFTINGVRVYTSGGIGSFIAPVALIQGLNEVTAVAQDLAGHLTMETLRFSLSGIPPQVAILDPQDGSTVEQSPIKVYVGALAVENHFVNSVTVNGESATYLTGGTWSVTVDLDTNCPSPLTGTVCPSHPEGEIGKCCLLKAIATDNQPVSASSSISVWYHDVLKEPLTVTSILPKTGAENVEVEEFIQINFSKPINPDTLPDAFKVTSMGQPVTGGISYLPGLQLVTFTPYSPFEYTARNSD